MKKIKFIYFDIGGVMADTTNYFKGATNKFGIPLDEFTKFWQENYRDEMTRGKITPQEFWKKIIKKFNLKNAMDFNFVESWMNDYQPRIKVHKLAKKLSKSYKIGLISNLYPGMMPALIKKGLVANIKYSAMVLSYEVQLRKPEKEIYEIATKKAGVLPEEILLIDDRQDFIEGAKRIGWQTVWFDLENINKTIFEIKKLLGV